MTERDLRLGELHLRACVRVSSLPIQQRYSFSSITSADIVYVLELWNKRNGKQEIRWTTRDVIEEIMTMKCVLDYFEVMIV